MRSGIMIRSPRKAPTVRTRALLLILCAERPDIQDSKTPYERPHLHASHGSFRRIKDCPQNKKISHKLHELHEAIQQHLGNVWHWQPRIDRCSTIIGRDVARLQPLMVACVRKRERRARLVGKIARLDPGEKLVSARGIPDDLIIATAGVSALPKERPAVCGRARSSNIGRALFHRCRRTDTEIGNRDNQNKSDHCHACPLPQVHTLASDVIS